MFEVGIDNLNVYVYLSFGIFIDEREFFCGVVVV